MLFVNIKTVKLNKDDKQREIKLFIFIFIIYKITNKTANEADLKSMDPLTYKPESLAPIK